MHNVPELGRRRPCFTSLVGISCERCAARPVSITCRFCMSGQDTFGTTPAHRQNMGVSLGTGEHGDFVHVKRSDSAQDQTAKSPSDKLFKVRTDHLVSTSMNIPRSRMRLLSLLLYSVDKSENGRPKKRCSPILSLATSLSADA